MKKSAKRKIYHSLPTEAIHPKSLELDARPSREVIALLLAEETRAVKTISSLIPALTRAVDRIVAALQDGGRLIYVGAGTSGRLGALDAAELPPTFGSSRSQVVAVLAGGARAMLRSVEGAEDRPRDAERKLDRLRVSDKDVVCAIAASGVTRFSRAALEVAKARGAQTIFVTCAKQVGDVADVVIAASVGPEVLAGSTRLKAGTATKIILNALSTATMMRLGKVYRGRMVDVVASNHKLRARALRIVMELCKLDERAATNLLKQARGSAKLAISMHTLGVDAAEALTRLAAVDGNLRRLR